MSRIDKNMYEYKWNFQFYLNSDINLILINSTVWLNEGF